MCLQVFPDRVAQQSPVRLAQGRSASGLHLPVRSPPEGKHLSVADIAERGLDHVMISRGRVCKTQDGSVQKPPPVTQLMIESGGETVSGVDVYLDAQAAQAQAAAGQNLP